MTPPSRLLIILLGAIGDVVCGMPLAQRIRLGWPGTRIAWAIEPPAAPLLQTHPAVDEVIVFRRDRGPARFIEFVRAVRESRPELTLDLQRHVKSGFTAWASGAPRRLTFHWRNSRELNRLFSTENIPPVDEFTLKLTHFQLFADQLGLPASPVRFGLAATAPERARADELLPPAGDRFAVLYLGSTWPSRQWLPDYTAELCAALRARGLTVVLVGGPGDVAFAETVHAAGAGEVVDTVGRTSLREVIAIMERATIAIGPDTGPMHIAAAVGTPVVAMFGATSPLRSGPWGWDHLVLRGDVPCAPCYVAHCPIGRLCMERITPAMVLERVDRALAGADERREHADEG